MITIVLAEKLTQIMEIIEAQCNSQEGPAKTKCATCPINGIISGFKCNADYIIIKKSDLSLPRRN
jgi:hypothetical protein